MAINNHPHAVAGFLYDRKHNAVLLHLRDGNTKINPNKWSLFAGACEAGETPLQTFVREIEEEIGLAIDPKEVKFLDEYFNDTTNVFRHVYYIEKYVPLSELTLGEGAGMDWVPLEKAFDLDLSEKSIKDLRRFLALLTVSAG